MHTSSFTKATYTQGALTGDAETAPGGDTDGGTFFQDVEVSADAVADGTLHQRLDPIAFPQKGIKYTGTDADDVAVPAPAIAVG